VGSAGTMGAVVAGVCAGAALQLNSDSTKSIVKRKQVSFFKEITSLYFQLHYSF
jgi:Na+/H+ antiporter NhaC